MSPDISLKRKVLRGATNIFGKCCDLLGPDFGPKFKAHLAAELAPIECKNTKHGPLRFHCPGELPLMRAKTLLSKEPETIEWIDSFKKGAIFWDIGANVGVYSLYAALAGCSRILAFEPSAFNYHLLIKNIEINNLDSIICGFCAAFDSNSSTGSLELSSTEVGAALHSFRSTLKNPDAFKGVRQGMLAFSLDEFLTLFNPPFPNHLKIDVDGLELEILKGGEGFLADRRLQSILIEFDPITPSESEPIHSVLEKAGFYLQSKHKAPSPPGSIPRVEMNHIFTRQIPTKNK